MGKIYEVLTKSAETNASRVVDSIGVQSSPSGHVPPTARQTGGARPTQEWDPGERVLIDMGAETVGGPSHGYRVARPHPVQGAPVFPFNGSHPQASEQYRILRTNLLQHPRNPKVIAVSSACVGDGKTITAINLAGILALKSNIAVVLVEADLRKRGISSILGIEPSPGLADVLRGRSSLKEAIVQIDGIPNLYVLPGGRVESNPAELLDSPVYGRAVAALRAAFSFVILDSAPAAVVADFNLIKVHCDGTVLVVRTDHTDRSIFFKATQANKDGLLGIVINAMEPWFLSRSMEDNKYYAGLSDSKGPAEHSTLKRSD